MIRVIARQVYVLAHAALGGIEGAREAALAGAQFLADRGLRADGQFMCRLGSDGVVLDPAADLYDIAFGLFAMAWWHRLSGEERPVRIALGALEHLRTALPSPSGKGFLAREGDAGPHQQNPHMHLFEAAIFLASFTGRTEFAVLADELFELAATTLFDAATGTLPELFDARWRPGDAAGELRVEPGHHYEWVWLLCRYAQLSGSDRALDIADRLFAFAQAHGHDPASGLVVDALDPTGNVLAADLRIWPNTEQLKAQVAMQERHGQRAGFDDAAIDATANRIMRHFLTPQPAGPAAALGEGLWIDYLEGGSLRPKCDHVPASTMYHIMFGFSELLRHRAGHGAFSALPW